MSDKKPKVSKVRDLSSLTGRAVGALGPASVNIIGGLMKGDLAKVATGTAQATGFFLKEAADAVFDRGSKVTGRLGMQMLQDIADKGASKGAEARMVWKRLLTNGMDERYTGEIRKSQLELLDSMISADAVLLYVLHHFREKMAAEVSAIRAQIETEMRTQSDHPMRHFLGQMGKYGTTYELIRKYWRTAFNAELQIEEEELGYALRDQNHKVFQVMAFAQMPNGSMMKPENTGGFSVVCQGSYNGLIVATLTEPADRLARLLGDPNRADVS